MGIGSKIEELLSEREVSQSELARRLNLSQSTINTIIRRDARSSPHLTRIARELETSVEYLTGETDDPAPGRAPPKAGKTIKVAEIDLAYGMGGTFLDHVGDEVPVTTEVREFDPAFLRLFTRADPAQIFFARGTGDSMAPTLLDSDIVLIDTTQKSLRMADQLWACCFGGVGMIKRLRPRPDGSVAILSDNPNVPEDRAVDGELHLVGRVVAVVRKT